MKHINVFFLLIFVCLLVLSCKNSGNDTSVEDSISSIVNLPVGADQIIDTSVAARFEFDETLVDWGTIRTGESFTTKFTFTNTGKRPGLISDVKTSCGCTATTYTLDPIPPGEKGEIKVTFNSVGRIGYQKKSINIIGNTYPPRTLLYLQGFISE